MDKATASILAKVAGTLVHQNEFNSFISKLLADKLPGLTVQQKRALLQLNQAQEKVSKEVKALLPDLKKIEDSKE